MGGASKDLVIATGILVGCVALLLAAFSDQDNGPTEDPFSPSVNRQLAVTQTNDNGADAPPQRRPELGGSSHAFDFGGGSDEGEPTVVNNLEPRVIETPFAPGPVLARPPEPEPLVPPEPVAQPRPEPVMANPGPEPVAQPEQPVRADEAESAGQRIHVVASGDELMRISHKYYGTHQRYRDIQRANPDLDPNNLIVGQKLVIPPLDDVIPAADHGRLTAGNAYIVKSGDNYWSIARDQLGDASRYRELAELNGGDDLMPGDRIVLPAGGRAATERRSSPPPTSGSNGRSNDRRLPTGATWHKVQEGEYLSDISYKYYGTHHRWRKILEANNLVSDTAVQAGTRLIIPDAGSSPTASERARSTSSASSGGGGSQAARPARSGPGSWYTIAKGDTIGHLSQRFYGTVRQHHRITEANPGINPNALRLGQKIWIPGADGAAAPRRSTSSTPATPSRSRDDRPGAPERQGGSPPDPWGEDDFPSPGPGRSTSTEPPADDYFGR